MPKKYLLSGLEIRSFRPTKRAHGTFFSLSSGPLSASHAKCATIVSKKVSLKAVSRNLVKRRARSVLAPLVAGLPNAVGVLLTAKKGAAEASYSDIRTDIQKIFQRV